MRDSDGWRNMKSVKNSHTPTGEQTGATGGAVTLAPDQLALTAQPMKDPRLEAIKDRIAELVAEALFNRMVKNVIENKVKQSKILVDDQAIRQTHDC